jgi:tRNA pseudouridine55 synthase
MEGLLLIDKPTRVTSFDVVGEVRSVAEMSQVGHMGTLDKAATGLLAVMVGNATTLQRFIERKVSEYRFEMRFGAQTDTLDTNGEVVRECEWEHVTASAVREALGSFVGAIEQRPPRYSAVKIDGRRASDWARDDDAPEVSPDRREVEIRELELEVFHPPVAQLRVECVSGTYVRSIVRDLAEDLDSCGHAASIRRLRTESFHVDDAVVLQNLALPTLREHLLSPREMLEALPAYRASADESQAVGYGQKPSIDGERVEELGLEPGDWVAVVDPEGELVAVAEYRASDGERLLAPERVLKPSG